MTDFWKSQERKYCDFCKCWITDNKPSIQFHESGKRHKENVAKKITELTKKSAKAQKESKKLDSDMKKMNEAAMKAYMKDMEANPDLTSQEYKKIQEEKAMIQQEDVKEIVKKVIADKSKKSVPPKGEKKVWNEAKTSEGYTYYWNSETKESVWEAPEAGFISIQEQEKILKAKEAQENEARQAALKLQESKQKESTEEARAHAARENMKKFRKEEEEEETKEVQEYPGPILGPAPKIDPYGAWTTVRIETLPPVDLQLPKAPRVATSTPFVIASEPKIKIKEKTVNSLSDHDSNASPVFKKRKTNLNRGNMRQRFDDD